MPPPAGTPCRPHEEPSAQRAGRVKAAAALRAVARSASLDAARPMGDLATERTQLLTRSPHRHGGEASPSISPSALVVFRLMTTAANERQVRHRMRFSSARSATDPNTSARDRLRRRQRMVAHQQKLRSRSAASGFAPKQTPIRQQDGTREVGYYALSFANSSASRSWLRPARSLA